MLPAAQDASKVFPPTLNFPSFLPTNALTYRVAVIFLLLYFVRPQDWVPGIAGLTIIKPLMLVGLIAIFTERKQPGESKWTPTPIDWLMIAYGIFLVYTAPDSFGALLQVIPLLAFYFVTTIALSDFSKLRRYLSWWVVSLFLIAFAGVLTRFGFDFTQAADLIDDMTGRLVLNTWLLNNPNALGHTVVLCIPLAYLMLWWKRPMTTKMIAIVTIIAAYLCTTYTESKGAFLVGAGGLVVAFIFGRSILVQIVVLAVALSIGIGGLMYLPRMSGMKNLRADEGVQGRLMAWEIARTAYESSPTGHGWKQFRAEIVWEGERYPKATHSTFVKIAADLGPIGLFLFVSLLYAASRTVIQYPGLGVESERCRRAIFLLLACYFASGWMIDRPYHTEFFLILAVAGAYLRISLSARAPITEESEGKTFSKANPDLLSSPWPIPLTSPPLLPASSAVGFESPNSTQEVSCDSNDGGNLGSSGQLRTTFPAKQAKVANPKKLWRRYGVVDFLIGIAAVRGIVWLWDYILSSI